ncbi:MAG: hypothetical protein HY553_14620 [Elusimicrobia bacterium]|nr:hypothetical protein [Elusimicrobiota bacterium]
MSTLRQGDVQFIRVDAVPDGAAPRRGRVLFRGEATGHAHVADLGELFETRDGLLYLRTSQVTQVSHEEHKTVTLQPGIYLVSQKRQADLDGHRMVCD